MREGAETRGGVNAVAAFATWALAFIMWHHRHDGWPWASTFDLWPMQWGSSVRTGRWPHARSDAMAESRGAYMREDCALTWWLALPRGGGGVGRCNVCRGTLHCRSAVGLHADDAVRMCLGGMVPGAGASVLIHSRVRDILKAEDSCEYGLIVKRLVHLSSFTTFVPYELGTLCVRPVLMLPGCGVVDDVDDVAVTELVTLGCACFSRRIFCDCTVVE